MQKLITWYDTTVVLDSRQTQLQSYSRISNKSNHRMKVLVLVMMVMLLTYEVEGKGVLDVDIDKWQVIMWFIAGGRGGRGGRGFRGFRGDKNNTEYLVNPMNHRRRRIWRRRRSWLVGVALDSVCYDSYLLCLCLCLWRWWGGLNTGINVCVLKRILGK